MTDTSPLPAPDRLHRCVTPWPYTMTEVTDYLNARVPIPAPGTMWGFDHTGGNCWAIIAELTPDPEGPHIMVTDAQGPLSWDDTVGTVPVWMVGYYAAYGDDGETVYAHGLPELLGTVEWAATEHDVMRCESCERAATHVLWNGKHALDLCLDHWSDDESIWLEAVMAFNDLLRDRGLAGQAFADLPPDVTDLLVVCVRDELTHRSMLTDGRLHALWTGARARYDEWYGPS